MNNKHIIQYIRRHNHRVGVIIATPMVDNPAVIGIGWSLTNRSAGDVFDSKLGIEIATTRAIKGTGVALPSSIQADIEKMRDRATRYFKGNTGVLIA